MNLPDEQFMTVREVGAYLRISQATVYRLIHGKFLGAIRVGKSFRIPVADAIAYRNSLSTNRKENHGNPVHS